MTPKQFIEKAVEGGWKPKWLSDEMLEKESMLFPYWFNCRILLDPLSWQAVGKVEGWKTWEKDDFRATCAECGYFYTGDEWKHNMHRMIDTLCEGRSIEQFLETL